MTKIIISYRRSDTDVFAGRVRDRIAGRYGEDSVFIDVDNIPFGKDFRVHIHDAMSEADAVLVIIGPKWLGAGKGGRSRILDETDPVRIEVETALSKHIPTIPILVGKTLMPKPEQLPDRLQNFAYVNAAPVDTGRDFHRDLNRVIAALNKILGLPLNTAERAAVVAETASAPAVASSGPIGEPKSAGDDGEPVAVAADPPRVERAMGIADIDGAGTTSRGRYKQLAAAICGVVIISGAAWWLWPGTASMAPAINIAPQPTAIPNTIDAQRKTTAVATASAVPSTATPPAVAALPAPASAPQPTAIPTPVVTLKSANSAPLDLGADAVRAFYSALSQGNGGAAAALVVPERQKGGLSAQQMTAFFSKLAVPLQLISVVPSVQNTYQATYTYRATTNVCTNTVIVAVTERDGRYLIQSIDPRGGC